MSDATNISPEPLPPLGARDHLLDLAIQLRQAAHLSPETRAEVADLLSELAGVVEAAHPSERVAESAAQAAQALHEPQHGLFAAARKRLEAVTAAAEVKAPVATGVARRLIDVLAEIGI